VTIVLDETIDPARDRVGRTIKAHLRDTLYAGGVTLAPAGTVLRIRVTGPHRGSTPPSEDVTVEALPIVGGLLPLGATQALAAGPSGTTLTAETQASVDTTESGHTEINIPLPLSLPTDAPYAEFTPIPLKTPAAVIPSDNGRGRGRGRRGASPTPRPSPSPSPSDSPSPSPDVSASGTPAASPLPAAAGSPTPATAASPSPAASGSPTPSARPTS
jgi:hypothetical protein